ncbi:MAG: ABC transporter permease, partial [Propionibacteriaceae bacterium]|nr:ABC transporter permease [Propionibacteriaceae bacterium]
MWATALRELKYHPARYVATLLAVAISVGFMAAASILTATESHAMSMQKAAPYTAADMVFTPPSRPADQAAATAAPTVAEVTEAIAQVPGVANVEPLLQTSTVITRDAKTEFSNLTALPSSDFRTVTLKEGAFPEPGQILLNSALMKNLGVSIGSTVKVDGEEVTVSGVSNDPTSLMLGNPAYLNLQWYEDTWGEPFVYSAHWLVRLAPDADSAAVTEAIDAATSQLGLVGSTQTEADFFAGAANSFTNGIDSFKYLLWVFAGVALVVGLITIANTFTILLTGRQRQIGLIRAIGATGKQVRHSIWAEGIILGLIGSLLGVGLACGLSALLGLFTGSIRFGLSVPLRDTVIAIALGVIVTFIACVAPARRATRIPPIEALQPAASAVVTRQVSIARAVICGLFIAAGVAGSILALTVMTSSALVTAIASAMCLAIGVLFGARLFVPGLLRGLAAVVKHWGPAANVATKNVVRDPRRAAATATALMLAVGLIVTLQVGSASIERTLTDKIETEFPIDLTLEPTS